MSSELQSVVSSIVENNYVTLIIITAVGYDYVLTFSDEIKYIWSKPWTWVSTLFLLVRYFGLCGVLIYALLGSPFLPGPVELYVRSCKSRSGLPCLGHFPGKILTIVGQWALMLFTGAADSSMILRVWALYGRSKIILGILLTLYVLEIVPYVVACITVSIKVTVITVRVLDFSFCVTDEGGFPALAEVIDITQFILSLTMCLLVTIQFIRHSLQIYKVNKEWQPSRYISLFAREGLLYFLAVFLFALLNILGYVAKIPFTGWAALPAGILENVPVFTFTPRFILSVRELYARDLRGRFGSRDIDSEFGFTSTQRGDIASIAFASANVERSEVDGLEQPGSEEEIQAIERNLADA